MTKSKSMENVTINPVDNIIKTRVDALNILNEFKRLGFAKGGFISVVQENIEEYKDYKHVKRMISFWDGRCNQEDLNNELQALLEKLKSE